MYRPRPSSAGFLLGCSASCDGRRLPGEQPDWEESRSVRVSVVSDVHGNVEGLAKVADQAEFLIVLGDLLEYVDYHVPEAGILGAVFGADAVAEFASLRRDGRFDEMHALEAKLWSGLRDPAATLDVVVRSQYGEIIDRLGPRTLVTLGNVDAPSVWDAMAPAHLRVRDGEVVDLDGLRFGFVAGGALKRPVSGDPWAYFERAHDTYRSLVADLGEVDVLCTHVPPDIEDLRYDVGAQRKEMYGPGLVESIDRHRPALSLFGHVHHPRAAEVERGGTRCVNVGFFKRNGEAFVFDTDALRP